MEKLAPLIIHLVLQGYTKSHGNPGPEYLHMYRKTNSPEDYPRFHLKIPHNFGTGFDLLGVDLHLDVKAHRVHFFSNQFREITVAEIQRIAKSLQSSQIDEVLKHPFLSGLNNLLLFQSAEIIRRAEDLVKEPLFYRFFRKRRKHGKYKRNSAWKQEEIEE